MKVNGPRTVKHRWRDYRTSTGRRPVADFIAQLPDPDAAEILAAMKEVATLGLVTARHLRGEIWEVRAASGTRAFRILFAPEGTKGRVLLALDGFVKKTRTTPDRLLSLAEQRLREWRSRGRVGAP